MNGAEAGREDAGTDEDGLAERVILLVDDDLVFRSVLARALRSRGYRVFVAGDYNAAIVILRLSVPRYAVLDVRLPGPSGLELLRTVKEVRRNTIVVMLTGDRSAATAAEAARLGAAVYLHKPADADDVIAALTEANGS